MLMLGVAAYAVSHHLLIRNMSLNTTSTPGYTFAASGGAAGASDVADPISYLYPHHSTAVAKSLIQTAQALVNPRGKGIYATDETIDGIEARLVAAEGELKVYTDAQKQQRRRRWRECLYESLPTEYISGVILYHETLLDFQLGPVLSNRGIIPGIRADTDAHPLPISPSEPATQGLDDLLPRLQAAAAAGARFSKWRAPILCNSSSLPTQAGLEVQAENLARFAAISQQAGLVPIVEPDVDFAEDADLKKSIEVHVKIISMIYARCAAYGVLLEGSLIKPSFAQPGLKHPSRSTTSVEEIGLATATILARSVPVAVAGVVFLSGGLSDSDTVKYLNAVNVVANKAPANSPLSRLPHLTFSFGRGLQGDAMQKWVKGDETGAQSAFEARAKACWLAAKGEA
ncbi:fructose-bisphosphate aldolase [Suillus clintonianus]|uniref:fructose-bisphosphate aldolase n=1 Tax=Suillus clintonianus TaxID=1904413 RepID=UPI001B86E98E|nr:fructose-bisphosphate aldolase [Suillus clintonianus]KAG2129117.1 fructose-bisphosphate aldolase [Suillus clintonianus]